MTRMTCSSRMFDVQDSYSTQLYPEQYEAVGTTGVIHHVPTEPVFTERSGGSRSVNLSKVARYVVGPVEPVVEDNSSPQARALLDKGLQKAVEETMAFECGLGHVSAPWEGR